MLEVLIKTLIASVIISFFLIISLKLISESVSVAFDESLIAGMRNELFNSSFNPTEQGFNLIKGEGNTLICKPSILNNLAGRVCVAS